jgi:hypothetical protein
LTFSVSGDIMIDILCRNFLSPNTHALLLYCELPPSQR